MHKHSHIYFSFMILRKGIKTLPKAVKPAEVERKSPPKAVQQPTAKTVKAVTKVGSLSDLPNLPQFVTAKRFTANITRIDSQGNLILGKIYTRLEVNGKKRTYQRFSIPRTIVPANLLSGASVGKEVSYSVVDGKAVDFKLESDLSTGMGLLRFTEEAEACITVSQAEMLAVTSGIHKNRQFFEMTDIEKVEFVRDSLFALLGENVTICKVKDVIYYSIPTADLSDAARVIFADKIANNTAPATSASTTATNVATTATTLTTATDNNVTASTVNSTATAVAA